MIHIELVNHLLFVKFVDIFGTSIYIGLFEISPIVLVSFIDDDSDELDL